MSDEQLTPLNDDSPPDPQQPAVYTANKDEFIKGLCSVAELEQDQEPGPVIKKGIGRPRRDGMPAKTDSLVKHPTPSPMYKKFYSEASSDNQKPKGFIKWCKACPTWVQERLTFYVYRDWPTLKEPALDETGKKEDNKYIDKLAECPENVQEFLDKYGAGDYRMIVNDDVVDKRTVAEIHVREGFRNIAMNPPTDRRIDDVGNVDLESTANRAYVQYLRGKGKLPEQQQAKGRDADMAEASALKEMTGMMKGMVERVMDRGDRGQNDTTATVVKEVASVMGETNKQISTMMADAWKTIDGARQQPHTDPLEYIKAAAELMRPREGQGGQGHGQSNEVVDVLKTYLEIESKRSAAAEQRNHELMEKLMEKNNPAPPPPPPPAQDALQTTEKTVESITKIASLLGLKARGEAAVVSGGSSWWKDNLPEIMQYGATMIQSGVRAYEISQVGRARQQMAQQPMQQQQPMHIVNPMAIPNGQQYQQPVEPIPQEQTEVSVEIPQQQPEDDGFNVFMAKIHEPLMNHIDKNLGGDAFAQWLIDGLRDGDAVYQQLKLQGPEVMIQGLKMYEPLWRELESKQALLPKFADEFMRMEEIVAAAEAEDLEEGGEGEEDEDGWVDANGDRGGGGAGIKLIVDR